jgi:hypothetical protein
MQSIPHNNDAFSTLAFPGLLSPASLSVPTAPLLISSSFFMCLGSHPAQRRARLMCWLCQFFQLQLSAGEWGEASIPTAFTWLTMGSINMSNCRNPEHCFNPQHVSVPWVKDCSLKGSPCSDTMTHSTSDCFKVSEMKVDAESSGAQQVHSKCAHSLERQAVVVHALLPHAEGLFIKAL